MQEADRMNKIWLTQKYHAGQLDRQGAPYWLHPYRVALYAEAEAPLYLKDDAFFVGLAHDILEDCQVDNLTLFVEEMLNKSTSLMVSVIFLTKPEIIAQKYWKWIIHKFHDDYIDKFKYLSQYTSYDNWIERIIHVSEDYHLEALYVKLADNIDNSQPWRAKPGKVAGIKYVNSMQMLTNHLKVE